MHELVKAVDYLIFSAEEDRSCSGFTWVPMTAFKKFCYKKSMDKSDLEMLVDTRQLILHVYDKESYITLPKIHEAENTIATELIRILYCKRKKYSRKLLESIIKDAEKHFGLTLHEQQREAVILAANNNFTIVTGGPGTGKTMVLNVIHYTIKKLNKYERIAYTAPTGKAARRITESTGNYAETLHKKLHIYGAESIPVEVEEDDLVVDEVSMNDCFITESLLRSVKSGHRIILVGDTEQLPSVGPGAVLRDLIESDAVPVARLTKTFRQAKGTTLFTNIQYIRQGFAELEAGDDFSMVLAGNDPEKQAIRLYMEECKKYGIENVCMLTPMRKSGRTCSNIMNRKLQAIINPKGKKPYFQTQYGYYQMDDIVMQLKNRDKCANGDVGRVVKVDREGIEVKYLDETVRYKRDEMRQITLAYAMTIHKSQGSEYKSVITLLLKEHKSMLQRNLFYTAVTRAKVKCTVLYEQDALEYAISHIDSVKRVTFLRDKIEYLKKRYETLGYAV